MTSPVESLASLVVGVVESVAPNQITVSLDLDAPHATALNTGVPTPFPRLNGYVLIPHEAGATVGYIAWMGIERSPYPKRSGLKDFGLIDLPFPLRKMTVAPVATLTCDSKKGRAYKLERGVISFPSVGDQVLIPTSQQVEAIVGAKESDKRVRIGSSPLASNATIMVDPDKLFGRHLAVLGNTGSGKSCTVAGLIRWSMEAARAAIKAGGRDECPNSRFIILDPNGEYAAAFADQTDCVRLFKVDADGEAANQLRVPAWMWNGHEWTAVSHAQPGAQRPLLMQGLRELKGDSRSQGSRSAQIKGYVKAYRIQVSALLQAGLPAFADSTQARMTCGRLLTNLADDCSDWGDELSDEESDSLSSASNAARLVIEKRQSKEWFNAFSVSDLESVVEALTECENCLPDRNFNSVVSEDAPCYFEVESLADHLDRIAVEQGGNISAFVATLGIRIRGMLADHHLGSVIRGDSNLAFEEWLADYVGGDGGANGHVAIIDLSLVPSEVVHVVVAVLGRLIFESLQRYRRSHDGGHCLPTVLVLEEAHSFIHRGHENRNPAGTASELCRETFEKIAREGRKFGLGLVISSQRPFELSPTVLAQCNTFLLHRIVNNSDQDLVGKLVPDNVAGLLKELPSLPSRQAILLGWATPIPVLVEMDELPLEHRPQSADPDFWDVWTLASERKIDWGPIAQLWAGLPDEPDEE